MTGVPLGRDATGPESLAAPRPASPVLAAWIVADFDAGMKRQQIADRHHVDYDYVARVLFKARRTERVRRESDLTAAQHRLFLALVEVGIPVHQASAAVRKVI